jgi:hypothetical protein
MTRRSSIWAALRSEQLNNQSFGPTVLFDPSSTRFQERREKYNTVDSAITRGRSMQTARHRKSTLHLSFKEVET